MTKHRMVRALLVLSVLLLVLGAVAPAEAQRRGGGGRKNRQTPVPPPPVAEAPADAGQPAAEAPPPAAAEPSPRKDAAVRAAESEILAYAIGPARAALAGTGDAVAAPALVAEGRVLTLEQKYDEAVSRFDRAAAAAPGDPAPLVYKGEALLYARQDGPARQALSTARARAQARVESNPSDAEAWLHLGMAQRHLGEHDAAYATLERAKALAPGDARVTYEMGATRYVQQRWQPAIDLLTQALASNPRLAYAYYLRGIAASQANRKDLTVNDLGRFVELAPGAPEAERARKVLDSLK